MNQIHMLTTIDNPFNPFEDFTSWYMFDIEKGYNTCAYLSRLAKVSDDMIQNEIDEAYEVAMDKIIAQDFMDIYIKIDSNGVKGTKNN